MPDFTGIYNENEFYFAHYLTSLMDDDLREFCASETGQTVQRRLRALAEPWRKGRGLREQVEKRGATRELREAYEAARAQLVEALAGALGYADHLTADGVFHGATPGLQIPVRAAIRCGDGALQACLIEVYRTGGQLHRDGTDLLDLHPADAQCAHLDTGSRSKLTSLVGHRATETLSWSNLITREIFGAPNAPRFVIVFGEDRLLLLERSKWAERRHLAFNLDEIFERGENATLRAMTGLLACPSLCPEAGDCLPDRLEENSHKNAFGVSKDLRIAMRDSIERLGNAILILDSSKKARKAAQTEAAEGTFSAAALSAECVQVMYRFLFVLFLESRRDIPYFDPPGKVLEKDIFWSAYGLDQLRDLELTPLLTPEAKRGLYFDRTVKQLFDKIYRGFESAPDTGAALALETFVPGFRLPPLASHLFDPDKTPLFNASDIPNEVWQQIVRNLSIGTSGTGKRRRKGRISYAQLGIQQLGAVYEALLSYTGFYATADLYEVCRSEKKSAEEAEGDADAGDADSDSDTDSDGGGDAAAGKEGDLFETGYFVTADELAGYKESEIVARDGRRVCHPKGTFIYRMAGRDREKSASYYTPAELTRTLVRHALAERIPAGMPADEIMRLKICEPAMGSAAFLNEAVDQIADLYLARKQQELKKTIPLDSYAREKARVKMVFADRNVYGVDLNPVATHLAEVSLWLGTIGGEGLPTGQAERAEPYIPWFGTQLRCGNSIVGARREIVLPDGARRSLAFNEPLPDGAVWHFLLPEEGMGDYTDKTVKSLAPEAIAAFKAWRADFDLPKANKASAAAGRAAKWKELHALSRAIESLWQKHVADLRSIDEKNADDIAYFGYTPHQAMYTNTATKDLILAQMLREQNLRESSAYCKLKLVMDLWCALWFWPLDAADALPSYDAFLEVVRLVVEKEWLPTLAQANLFEAQADPAVKEAAVAYLQQKMDVESLGRVYPFVPVVARVAAAQHFMHWELEFAQLFADCGGFDLILGNPPWVRVRFDEAGILSEYDPHIAVRKMSSDQTAKFRDDVFARKPAARAAWLAEYAAMAGLQNYLASASNYPVLKGVQSNLFKFFLPLAFLRLASPQGVSAYLHPEGVYDDPRGGALRRAMYPRLRLHAQFINELYLFSDIHHMTGFSLNVYGPVSSAVRFMTVAGLYHPSTLRESLERTDESQPLPLVRENDTWNLRGHPNRVVTVDEVMLALFARTYDEAGTSAREARLPALYTRLFAEMLPRFANFPSKMAGQDYGVSYGWDETAARKDGTIRRETGRVAKLEEVIYSGPIFYVGNPLAKCPRLPCRLNSDYDTLDLTALPPGYRVRTNYVNARPTFADYCGRMAKYQGKPAADYWRVCCRNMCGVSSERTLISCMLPRGYAHVNTVIGFAFSSALEATSVAGQWASLPLDWFFRSMGKNHFHSDSAQLLPYLSPDARVIRRALMLNCLTTDWAELWAAAWAETDLSGPDGWLSDCPVLPPDAFAKLGPAWTPALPLRSALARRQALVELDVLAARGLGLSLEELQTMFRISFTTLRKYDGGTWYDQNGRVVFTCQNKAGGVPRKIWEAELLPRKDEPGFTYSHTEADQAFTDAKTPRTTLYAAPFFAMDRERDYETAWRKLDGIERVDSIGSIPAKVPQAPDLTAEGTGSQEAKA